ncbi:MAG: FAD binding domain-containing protein [Candidatus Thalassarchaeaceae archaeon]|nr:FAD binding domain-containing protein [Candidatus Thalassarchaeaceae archaeon]
MRMPPFTLHTPNNLAKALALANELDDFDWVAGGTDLLPNYKWHLNPKSDVISLAKVQELTALSGTVIGAMVRIHDLCNNEEVHPLIREAAGTIASVMIRRSATVGGNICLDTRCYWFNQTEEWRRSIDWCHKCDCDTNADCRVIPNQNTLCVATYQADLAAAFIALDATIHLAGTAGARSMPFADFFELDGMTRNVLKPGELVTHVTLPDDAKNWQGAYQKLRLRETWDFPEAGVAAAWKIDDGKIAGLRIATTGCESIPGDHSDLAQDALVEWVGKDSIRALAEDVRKAVKPVSNTYFPPAYRRKMLRVLTRRALAPLEHL